MKWQRTYSLWAFLSTVGSKTQAGLDRIVQLPRFLRKSTSSLKRLEPESASIYVMLVSELSRAGSSFVYLAQMLQVQVSVVCGSRRNSGDSVVLTCFMAKVVPLPCSIQGGSSSESFGPLSCSTLLSLWLFPNNMAHTQEGGMVWRLEA